MAQHTAESGKIAKMSSVLISVKYFGNFFLRVTLTHWMDRLTGSIFVEIFKKRISLVNFFVFLLLLRKISISSMGAHHAEGLVDPNLRYKKTVTVLRYPRACRFRKYQFENKSWELPLPTFFKT
jgi:hypothetical protein